MKCVSERVISADMKPPDENAVERRLETPGTLFEVLESSLLHYAMKRVNQWETAQDIVQEAFLRLHAKWDEVRQPKSWLYRTVHNLAVSYFRAGARREFPEEEAGEVHPDEEQLWPDSELERMERYGLTRLCLQRLPERERQLLEWKFTEGLTYKEMAERGGLKAGHVGYLLHHALKQMGQELAREGLRMED